MCVLPHSLKRKEIIYMMFEITGNIRITDVIRIGKERYRITKIISETIKENEKVSIVETKKI